MGIVAIPCVHVTAGARESLEGTHNMAMESSLLKSLTCLFHPCGCMCVCIAELLGRRAGGMGVWRERGGRHHLGLPEVGVLRLPARALTMDEQAVQGVYVRLLCSGVHVIRAPHVLVTTKLLGAFFVGRLYWTGRPFKVCPITELQSLSSGVLRSLCHQVPSRACY